jgi:hypothetical protein
LKLDGIAKLLPAGPLGDQAASLVQALSRLDDPKGVYAYCFCTPALGGTPR